MYSPRPGTPAAFLKDDVTEATKLTRLDKLQAINEAQAKVISQAMLGTEQRVLIEGVSWKDPSLLAGKTDNNRVVDIKGEAKLIHQFVNVKITDVSNPRRLFGMIV